MKNSVFLTFCLMIVTIFVSAHALFRDSLSPVDGLRSKIEELEREKREAEFQAQLAEHRLSDFQQDVATLLPSAIKGRENDAAGYPLRQLASVQLEPEGMMIERASGLMDKAKKAFRDQDLERAMSLFSKIISKYPDSSHLAEAHFLLAESQYQHNDYEAAIATIEKMIDLFPENELTGYALLRLANIFEAQDRLEDAGDIYRAVLNNFKQKEIVRQASVSLKSVAL